MTTDKPRSGRRPPRRASAHGRCPICGAATRPQTRPFCSRRCADADLGRWLSGAYRVPTDEAPGEATIPESREDDDNPNGGT
ncbi:MAG TPA: DNA gyrase inhibitor YacG [Kiloniellales bacterium]